MSRKAAAILKAVGQMMAAGWGATGSAADTVARCSDQPSWMRTPPPNPEMELARFSLDSSADSAFGDMDVPTFLRRPGNNAPTCLPGEILAILALDTSRGKSLPTTLAELAALGFPQDLLEQLAALVVNEGHEESSVVRVLIALLARSAAGASLSIEDRAALEGTVMTDRNLRSVRAAVQTLVDAHQLRSLHPDLA